MAAVNDTAKFVNPLDDSDAAQNPGFDPTGAVVKVPPVKKLKMPKSGNFDDDPMQSPLSQDGAQQYSPRTQQRVNAHHVQKFVGDQSTSHPTSPPACALHPVGFPQAAFRGNFASWCLLRCSPCAVLGRSVWRGDGGRS